MAGMGDGCAAEVPGLGPSASAFRGVLDQVPRASRWLIPAWASAFRGTEVSTIEPRARALLLLRVASIDRSAFWRIELEAAAGAIGITTQEVTQVESDEWEVTPGFTARERAAVLWGDRVARRLARRDARAYEAVRAEFSELELVELTLIAALAAMADRFTNALRVPPDLPIGMTPANGPVTEAALGEWTAAMFGPEPEEER